MIETFNDDELEVLVKLHLGMDTLEAILMKFDGDSIPDYEKIVYALGVSFCPRRQTKLELDLKNRETPPTKPFIEIPPVLELKALLSYLSYAFLGENDILLLIIAADLRNRQKASYQCSNNSKGPLRGLL